MGCDLQDFSRVIIRGSQNEIGGRMRGLYGTYRVSQMLYKGPNLVRLHMDHLIGVNIAAWYDF